MQQSNKDNSYNYNPDSISLATLGGVHSRRSLNGLEILIIAFMCLGLLVVSIWGVWNQEMKNRDKQRFFDITQVIIPALDEFYQNTNAVEESKRFYPVSRCSADANEVDYEFVLRQHLTGLVTKVEDHAYIKPQQFPIDRSGKYSQTLKDRQVPFRCQQQLSFVTQQSQGQIYKDYASCNFQKNNVSYRLCYLYGSSATGDSYSVGYYSESTNCFNLYTRFRQADIKFVQECR
jgi:hypothetical protein